MDTLLWLIIMAVGIGIVIYYAQIGRERTRQANEKRSSEFNTAADHFADLLAKNIQIKLIAGGLPDITLRNGEDVLCLFPQTTLVEPRAVRDWHSTYGGPSIRVAKGLSFRFGQSYGHSESHEELRDIDVGTLVLTNERIVFVGFRRTSSVHLEKLVGIEGFSNGLFVHREGKQKTEGYQLSSGMMNYEYEGQTLTTPIDGRLIKIVIDLAITVHQDAGARASVALSNGDKLLAQGTLDEALKQYRDSFSIWRQLITADPGDTRSQRALSISDERIGEVLKQQGNFQEAVKFFRDCFTIRERLAKATPSDTHAQRDLSISNDRLAEVAQAQGNLDEALQFYRDGFAIRERLAKADPGNKDAQRELMVSYVNVGDVLKDQGHFDEALKRYHYGLTIAESLAKADPKKWQKELQYSVERIGVLSYKILKARDFSQALDVANQAISAVPDLTWLYIIRAHALMFLGQVDEARAIYFQYRGHEKVHGDNSWDAIVLKDFADLRKSGMTHSLMDQVEKVFSLKNENSPSKLAPPA